MKEMITNNWKKILMAIGGFFIVINIIYKIAAPKTLLKDYIKYGKDVQSSKIIEEVTEVVQPPNNLVNGDMLRIVLILGALILFVVLITTIAEKKSGASAKKK
jgi:hypothetical protein